MPFFKSTEAPAVPETVTPVINLNVSRPESQENAEKKQPVSFWPSLFGMKKAEAPKPDYNATDNILPKDKVMVIAEDSNGFMDVQVRPLSYAEKASLSYIKNPTKYAAPKAAIQVPLDAVYADSTPRLNAIFARAPVTPDNMSSSMIRQPTVESLSSDDEYGLVNSLSIQQISLQIPDNDTLDRAEAVSSNFELNHSHRKKKIAQIHYRRLSR